MIAFLSGVVIEKSSERMVLDVNGVGYEVFISLNTFFSMPEIGKKYDCLIQTIVREDAITLYGFSEIAAKSLFQALIKVSGIGPKVALNILSSVTPEEFSRVVQRKDPKGLVKLPGIGKKTAERLLIELSDKLPKVADDAPTEAAGLEVREPCREEAVMALVALGYQQRQAEKVISQVDDNHLSTDQLIRLGLKHLSPVN